MTSWLIEIVRAPRCAASSGGCVEKNTIQPRAPLIFSVASAWCCVSTSSRLAARRRSAASMRSRPASVAPPRSARNSRWRENHAVISEPRMPSTISRTITTMKLTPQLGIRDCRSTAIANAMIAREEHHERVDDALQQRHRHHVAVGDVRDLVREHAFHFVLPHRAQQAVDTATRLRLLLGPVAKAFTSADS